MYRMRSIIDHSDEITLPKCMYHIKNPNETLKDPKEELDISIQAPNTKMSELEQRQEALIKKLDTLYNRIKTISSYCNVVEGKDKGQNKKCSIPTPDEVVLVVDPDNLPWYLNKVLQEPTTTVNLSWHIHSSVPNEKVAKIKAFVKGLKIKGYQTKINLRLIFKIVSADSELKMSSLATPIVGTVNILRYLSYAYPNTILYDDEDFQIDSFLDICHLIEKASDKNKEKLIKQLFSKSKDWIYDNKFTIVDLAAYNVIKQTKSNIKSVPKPWFEKCENLCA